MLTGQCPLLLNISATVSTERLRSSVQGKPMRFSDITDGDTEQMTAEEYEAYFAVLSGM